MQKILFFVICFFSLSNITLADTHDVPKYEVCAQCEPVHNITVNPPKISIPEINTKLATPVNPIPIKVVKDTHWTDNIFTWVSILISLLAVFISVYNIHVTQKAYEGSIQKSINDDHWFRQVIHPHCFLPCLEFIKWASQNFNVEGTKEKRQEYSKEYDDRKRILMKSIKLLYISKNIVVDTTEESEQNEGDVRSAVEEIEKILFDLEDRLVIDSLRADGEEVEVDPEARYATGDFFFEYAMNDISMIFKSVQVETNTTNDY